MAEELNCPSTIWLCADDLNFSCLFFVDQNANLITEEVSFGYKAWTNFHTSIVGFKPLEYSSEAINVTDPFGETTEKTKFTLETGYMPTYSMVDLSAGFVHRYYLERFNRLPSVIREVINSLNDCEQVFMNMLVSEHTGQGPILLTTKVSFLFINKILSTLFSRIWSSKRAPRKEFYIEMKHNIAQAWTLVWIKPLNWWAVTFWRDKSLDSIQCCIKTEWI